MTTYNLFGSTTPSIITDPSASPLTLGVEFSSSIDGNLTGVRFYKSATNTGTHIGTIWTVDGLLIATVTFSGESASGWQEMSFATPVPISANIHYFISVFMPNGHFSKDAHYFDSVFTNSPLTAYASADTTLGNGRYDTTGSSAFPTNVFENSNYWVDVIFQDTSLPSTSHTLLGSATPGTSDSGDASEVNLALVFKSINSGYIKGVRFYKDTNNTGTHIGTLRAIDTTLLGQVTFTGETASGWQEMLFSSPIAIVANVLYQMTVYMPVGHYSRDSHYFDAQVNNFPLIGIITSDTPAGNGEYAYGNSATIPNASFDATNYWVDALFIYALPSAGNLKYPARLDGLGYQFRGLE